MTSQYLRVISIVFLVIFVPFCSEKKEKSKLELSTLDPISIAEGEKANYPSIVFLGDSLTAGRGLPISLSLPSLFSDKLEKNNLRYKVINGGRSGDTTAGGLARVDWYLKKDVKAQHFVIGLGANDSMRGVPTKDIASNLRKIIRKVRAFDKNIRIYLWQMYTFPNIGKKYAEKYARIFYRVSSLEKVTLLPFPLKGVANQPDLNQADGIHPNAKGVKVMTENIWKVLRSHL